MERRIKMAGCPYDKVCVDLEKDDKGVIEVHCPLYHEMHKRDRDGNVVHTEGKCAHTWTAILLGQMSDQMMGVQAASEGGRNAIIGLIELARTGKPPKMDQPKIGDH